MVGPATPEKVVPGGENGEGEGGDEGAKVAETPILTVVGQREAALPKVVGASDLPPGIGRRRFQR